MKRLRMKSIRDSGLPRALLASLSAKFAKSDKNQLAQTVASRSTLTDVVTERNVLTGNAHIFNVRVATEGKPVTNQRASGRCWIFACLNCMRVELMKKLQMEELELSQNYLFFWDKVERSFYNLNVYLDCALAGEEPTGRLIQHLLKSPLEDGGQWDMIVNLVEKYGVMPKACWTETWSCENSRVMNGLLESKLREFCANIYDLVRAGKSEEEIRGSVIPGMMEDLYRIVAICLGSPPEQFTFEYYANPTVTATGAEKPAENAAAAPPKTKLYRKIGPITPLDFYQQYVKPNFDMEQKVVVVHDPREGHDFGRTYTVDKLNNMHGRRGVLYLNLSIQQLKDLSLATLKRNQLVWFGCHVSRCLSWKNGYNALDIHNFKLLMDVDFYKMDKGRRLLYGDSLMTHAMSFTGCQVDREDEEEEEKALEANGDGCEAVAVTEGNRFHRWRVENSWGADLGNAGYITMTDTWFDEYVYEVAIDRSLLKPELLRVLDESEPVVLPAWDPMGALARD